MSNLKYWYIDDEDQSPEQSTLEALNRYGVNIEKLDLASVQSDFGKLKNKIIELSKNSDFGGLLLDLRLDGSGTNKTQFNATAIAQELRSVAGRGEIRIFPMVLTSTDKKIKETYNNDKTSHDLFDYKMYKSAENIDWEKRAKKLNALAYGYNSVIDVFNDNSKENKLLGLLKNSEISKGLFHEKFSELCNQNDHHYLINFILKEMFHYSNPLINKRILFSKLGVSYNSVSESDLNIVSQFFEPDKYTGVFSIGWDRWWLSKVEAKLDNTFGIKFGFIGATKRVKLLNEQLKTNLVPSEKPKYCSSDEYSTICQATKEPIDHIEAFKIMTSHGYLPWQSLKYLSPYAVLERIKRNEVEPHPAEKPRIKELKDRVEASK